MEVVKKENQVTMSSKEIAEIVGKRHGHVVRDIRDIIESLKDEPDLVHQLNQGLTEFKDNRGYTSHFNLNRFAAELLVTGYDVVRRAKVLNRLMQLESEKAKSDNLAYKDVSKIEAELIAVKYYSQTLNAAPSSSSLMIKNVVERNGLDSSFLPAYEVDAPPSSLLGSSEATAPISTLLKDHNLDYLAKDFNIMLEKAGVLTRLVRKDSKGRDRKYWNITTLGLEYGKNITSPHNPRETQPHWYISKFEELLELVGV